MPIENNQEAPQEEIPSSGGGLWGKRSKRDVLAVVSLVTVAVVALVVVLVMVASNNKDDNKGNNITSSETETTIPTSTFSRPTEEVNWIESPQSQLDVLLKGLEGFEATESYLTSISKNADDLKTVADDAKPEVKAASWLIHTDPWNDENQLVRRFALATMYYENGGIEWTNFDKWMTNTTHCDWYGVICAGDPSLAVSIPSYSLPVNDIFELDLYRNNVKGELCEAMVLLQGLHTLFMSFNSITGPLKDSILSNLPLLMKVYLQHNEMTGTIPTTLRKHGKMSTIYLQANHFTGDWPDHYCRSCPTCADNIHWFGIDCDEINCVDACCDYMENCFFPQDEK